MLKVRNKRLKYKCMDLVFVFIYNVLSNKLTNRSVWLNFLGEHGNLKHLNKTSNKEEWDWFEFV